MTVVFFDWPCCSPCRQTSELHTAMALENGSEISPLEKKIIRQVEYYFGDINLPRDTFLKKQAAEDDGWVTMDVMLNFNRLKSISDDKEAICRALQKSTTGLMEVNEDFTKIRRHPSKPLPENTKERKEDLAARSVYVKGFPVDSTRDDLNDFFEPYGKIDTIFMRTDRSSKEFKGSVFVTFSNMEDENKFLGLEEVKYKDTPLSRMKKDEYYKMKNEMGKERKKNPQSEKDKQKAEEKKEEAEKKVEDQMTKGAVLFMKGLPKDATVDSIKTFFGEFGDVGWVEFATGDEKALVRFNEGVAQAALDKAKKEGDGKVVMKECELELRVLEGEEEKEYWRKMFKDIADRKQSKRKQGHKGHHQNRKRKFGNRSNKQDNKDDGQDNKDDGDDSLTKKAKKGDDDVE